MEQRLSLVTLGAADPARATAFYEAIGWTRSLRGAEGFAWEIAWNHGFPIGDDGGIALPA